MTTTLYSDFNCPFCYVTEERLRALGAVDLIAWRGVEHAPELPAPLAPAGLLLALELPVELHTVAQLASEVPIAPPQGKPNTAAAIALAAAAERVDPARGAELRRALYQAFWMHGRDLSDASVLAELTAAAGLPALEPGPVDEQLVSAWHAGWQASGMGAVPLLVRDDGDLLFGLADHAALRTFLARPARG